MVQITRAVGKNGSVIRKALVLPLMIVLATLAFAGKHPLPLDKGITDDKCIECHEGMTKGKGVHPALAMGCFSCHVVRGSGDETRVSLKTPKSTTLCITCHADKKAPANAKREHFHPPVASDCLLCHDPHKSENKALLKKATSGAADSNLCLKCHTKMAESPEKGSHHAALDMGCDTCHVTHKSGKDAKLEIEFHLTKDAPALCVDCHDASDANLIKAHKGQPFGKANCINCHEPHLSKQPKLIQAFVHTPFGMGCDTCHEAPVDGKVKLNQPDVKTLCVSCHGEVGKKIESAKAPHAGALGDCTDCHDPHAGRFPRFVRPDPVGVCNTCHVSQPEDRNTKPVVHGPVAEKCSECHEPHGGDNPKLLRAVGDNLCMECHSTEAEGQPVAGTGDVTIFNKTVQIPARSMQVSPRLALSKGKGHPLRGHPVSGDDPSNPGRQLSCLRCHKAHAGEHKLLVTDNSNSKTLCDQCHAKPK